jgi:hypothetical protein
MYVGTLSRNNLSKKVLYLVCFNPILICQMHTYIFNIPIQNIHIHIAITFETSVILTFRPPHSPTRCYFRHADHPVRLLSSACLLCLLYLLCLGHAGHPQQTLVQSAVAEWFVHDVNLRKSPSHSCLPSLLHASDQLLRSAGGWMDGRNEGAHDVLVVSA